MSLQDLYNKKQELDERSFFDNVGEFWQGMGDRMAHENPISAFNDDPYRALVNVANVAVPLIVGQGKWGKDAFGRPSWKYKNPEWARETATDLANTNRLMATALDDNIPYRENSKWYNEGSRVAPAMFSNGAATLGELLMREIAAPKKVYGPADLAMPLTAVLAPIAAQMTRSTKTDMDK